MAFISLAEMATQTLSQCLSKLVSTSTYKTIMATMDFMQLANEVTQKSSKCSSKLESTSTYKTIVDIMDFMWLLIRGQALINVLKSSTHSSTLVSLSVRRIYKL